VKNKAKPTQNLSTTEDTEEHRGQTGKRKVKAPTTNDTKQSQGEEQKQNRTFQPQRTQRNAEGWVEKKQKLQPRRTRRKGTGQNPTKTFNTEELEEAEYLEERHVKPHQLKMRTQEERENGI